MRNRLTAVIIMVCACLFAQTAFADDCPEGTVGFVNMETYEKVCIPQNGSSATSAEVNDTVKDIAADVKAVENQAAAAATDTTPAVTATETAPAATATDAAPAVTAFPVAQPSVQPFASNMSREMLLRSYVDPKKERIAKINASMKEPGVLMKLGIGYGLFLNANLKFLVGYKFGAEGAAAFGLYLDLNMRPGMMPFYSMDVTVAPTIHAMAGRFMFSFSVGLGAFLQYGDEGRYSDDWEYYEDDKPSTKGYFELKPALAFDWFLTNQALFGFGFDVPVYILAGDDSGAMASFSLDIHVGYRF